MVKLETGSGRLASYERMGVMEQKIKQFIDRMIIENPGIEAVALANKDEVLLEHRFVKLQSRNIYSHTKSFMSTAAGIALEEGALTLEDPLVKYFPDKVPEVHQKWLREIRFRHLLTMSSGFGKAYLMIDGRRHGEGLPDYLEYMMSREVLKKPGTEFDYSTADSHLAGLMLAKAVGKNLNVYLYEKLFRPLGMDYPIWECDPQGNPNGGSGLFLNINDQIKLGQLYLADGVWKGERILSSLWIKEATRKQIETTGGDSWNCGYGYQFWMMPQTGAYRADGAYGQITIVLPKQGYVVAVQCSEYGNFEKVKQALNEIVLADL